MSITKAQLLLLAWLLASCSCSTCDDTSACRHACSVARGCSCLPWPAVSKRLLPVAPFTLLSSTHNSSFTIAKVFDGSVATFCLTRDWNDEFPWLALKVGEDVAVERVVVVNRVSSNISEVERSRGMEVRVSGMHPIMGSIKFTAGTLLGSYAGPMASGQVVEVVSSPPVVGDWVIVQMANGGQPLNLAEIIVYGH